MMKSMLPSRLFASALISRENVSQLWRSYGFFAEVGLPLNLLCIVAPGLY